MVGEGAGNKVADARRGRVEKLVNLNWKLTGQFRKVATLDDGPAAGLLEKLLHHVAGVHMDEVVAGAKAAVVPCVESGIPALVNFSFGVEAVEGGVDGWAGLLAGLHDHIVQPKESITIDAWHLGGGGDKGKVKLLVSYHLVGLNALVDKKRHLGVMTGDDPVADVRHEGGAEAANGRDGDGVGEEETRFVYLTIKLYEFLRNFQECLAARGENDVLFALFAVDEGTAQLVFQLLDAGRDGRLGLVEQFCRLGDATCFTEDDIGLEKVMVHKKSTPSLSNISIFYIIEKNNRFVNKCKT